jgi:hypothetical protein
MMEGSKKKKLRRARASLPCESDWMDFFFVMKVLCVCERFQGVSFEPSMNPPFDRPSSSTVGAEGDERESELPSPTSRQGHLRSPAKASSF